jgi:hypothetical protein
LCGRGGVCKAGAAPAASTATNHQESDMMPETQIYLIARQMLERHGFEAIAHAARNAKACEIKACEIKACETKGEAEQAKEWRHVEDAMKIMRGPHQC